MGIKAIQTTCCKWSATCRPFLSGITQTLPNAEITVDWFHIVQTFTRSLDEVRKQEHSDNKLPKHSRWALVKKWGV